MPAIGRATTEKVAGLLASETGLAYSVAELRQSEAVDLPVIGTEQILAQNISAEVAERRPGVIYPAFYVYCDRLRNDLKEKFRLFSGKADMAVEVRVSSDTLDTLGSDLQLYAAAVITVLDTHRGDWGDGTFYAGGYTVDFGPVKRGGRNFLQGAKIAFQMDVSY